MDYLFLAVGLALLLAGGEVLVRGASALASRLGMPAFVVGVVVVGFGTSTPELLTSVQAALLGSPGIAVGNVVGSNIANILLILGLAALLSPIAVDPAVLRRDGVVTLVAALACVALGAYGAIDRITGTVLVVGLLAYLYVTLRHPAGTPEAAGPIPSLGVAAAIALALGGLAAVIAGADLLVDAAIAIARDNDVPESVIGLTVVAVGTSLPELATSLVAAARRQSDIAFGNILGSNIYNVFGILGVTALVEPMVIPVDIATSDVWVMVAATVLLLAFAATGRRICRTEGAAFVALYAGYTAWLIL